MSKIIVVDGVQFCCQILSFLSILQNMMQQLIPLDKVPQFKLAFKLKFHEFLNLFFFYCTEQNQSVVIFWLTNICSLACYRKLTCYISKILRKLEGRFSDLPEFFMWDTYLYMSLFLSVSLHSSFLVHMCKMMICSGVFDFFKSLIFQVVKGVNGQKRDQNDKTFCHLSYTCVK